MAAGPRSAVRGKDCVVVVAAAGYGKTTLLERRAASAGGRYATAPELADLGLTDLSARLSVLVVDDLDRLSTQEQAALLRALAGLPSTVPIVLASRRPLGRTARGLLKRPLIDRGAVDLALSPAGNARVLREEYGVADTDAAEQVYQLTGGWPALAHLAGDVLGRRGVDPSELLAALSDPGTPAAEWVRGQVLAELTPPAVRVLDLSLDVGPVTATLCAELAPLAGLAGPSGGGRAREAFTLLVRSGVLVPDPRSGGPRAREAFRPVPVLAAVLRFDRRPRDWTAVRERQVAASAWYEQHGYPLAAAVLRHDAGDQLGALTLIEGRAAEMLAGGGATEVAQLLEAQPRQGRSPHAQLVLGDARRMAGDPSGAARAFEPLTAEAARTGGWAAALAWRVAMVHYMTGDFRTALDVCAAALPGVVPGAVDVDTVHLYVVRTAALLMVGETDESSACAGEALRRADGSGDDRALAAANLGAALTTRGEQREAYLRRAYEAAERAGDVVQLARILVNQADGLLDDARYATALDVAQRALRAAEQGAPPGLCVAALANVGEALMRLGSYDEAAFFFERSTRRSRQAGLRRAAPGLAGLGEVGRQLGHREQARMALEEAVEHARAAGEMQILVPALAGLTRLLLDGDGTDLQSARAAAEEAETVAPLALRPPALVARGWVALAEGDLALAQDRAGRAITAARAGRSMRALAESLELAALASPDVDIARGYLQEALALWQRAGAAPAADRTMVLLGRLPGADGADRVAAREAGHRLLARGVRAVDGHPALPEEGVPGPLHIRVLGGFEVLVNGRPVAMTAWRSRQARTLVKILAARRGRPIPRGELSEILWRDEEPQRTAHRLSVLLSVVRGVLDPARAWDADHYLRADHTGVALDLSHATVDALDLLRDAAHAERLARTAEVTRARDLLVEVDAAYRGDAFEEEPYEEWANALREETRAVWMRALRTSAELARQSGEHDQAITTVVRLLAADPLDESAHRLLVGVLVDAGRHGEARRAFDRWRRAMRSIDAPVPSESVLRAGGTPSS